MAFKTIFKEAACKGYVDNKTVAYNRDATILISVDINIVDKIPGKKNDKRIHQTSEILQEAKLTSQFYIHKNRLKGILEMGRRDRKVIATDKLGWKNYERQKVHSWLIYQVGRGIQFDPLNLDEDLCDFRISIDYEHCEKFCVAVRQDLLRFVTRSINKSHDKNDVILISIYHHVEVDQDYIKLCYMEMGHRVEVVVMPCLIEDMEGLTCSQKAPEGPHRLDAEIVQGVRFGPFVACCGGTHG